MTPASAPRWRIAKARSGVGRGRGRRRARPPAATTTAAVSRAKTSESWRASKPTTTVGAGVGAGVPRAAARLQVLDEPGCGADDDGAVHPVRAGPQDAAQARRCRTGACRRSGRPGRRRPPRSPARAASITAASSARVAGSGSSASQALARASRSASSASFGIRVPPSGGASVDVVAKSRASREWSPGGRHGAGECALTPARAGARLQRTQHRAWRGALVVRNLRPTTGSCWTRSRPGKSLRLGRVPLPP